MRVKLAQSAEGTLLLYESVAADFAMVWKRHLLSAEIHHETTNRDMHASDWAVTTISSSPLRCLRLTSYKEKTIVGSSRPLLNPSPGFVLCLCLFFQGSFKGNIEDEKDSDLSTTGDAVIYYCAANITWKPV